MQTPSNYYQQKVQASGIIADPKQQQILLKLDKIHQDLMVEHQRRRGFLSRFKTDKIVKGLYLWGGVGIGKTFLMDCLYLSLPFETKMRMHFHQFMHMIHAQMKIMQGEKNPLDKIAKQIAKKAMVLCFDEFFVSDITDAMILANLLNALFENGVCLVTTSNIHPDSLYYRGLQRQQFLPAIDSIKKHCRVVHLDSGVDYRRRYLKDAGVFYLSSDELSHHQMEKTFAVLTNEIEPNQHSIHIYNRPIKIKKRVGDIVWFDFKEICSVPRSQNDYLMIADEYHTVFISNVPYIAVNDRNTMILFIKLIDVFYDAQIRIIMSAAAPVEELYTQGPLEFEYQRTVSRLLEMQSEAYYSQ